MFKEYIVIKIRATKKSKDVTEALYIYIYIYLPTSIDFKTSIYVSIKNKYKRHTKTQTAVFSGRLSKRKFKCLSLYHVKITYLRILKLESHSTIHLL